MIRLSKTAIMTVGEDGIKQSFDIEKLRERLEMSCATCGINDKWFAEDIALSVEYVLHKINTENRTFTESEINSYAVMILENSGLGRIATAFKSLNVCRSVHLKTEYSLISAVIVKYLGIKGENLDKIAKKVENAFQMLGVMTAPELLIAEIAKFYIEEDSIHYITTSKVDMCPEIIESPWCVTPEQAAASLSGEALNFYNKRIIEISPVSKIFPSVKLRLWLTRYLAYLGAVPPVTEMFFFPHYENFSEILSEFVGSIENGYGSYLAKNRSVRNPENLPIYLRVPDAAEFLKDCMGLEWPQASSCLEEILAPMVEMTGRDISLTNVSKTAKSIV